MAYELLTSWMTHDAAVGTLLHLATRSIRVFDEDLERLKLERPENVELLQRFLAASPSHRIQIVLRSPGFLRSRCPRLMRLVAQHSENLHILSRPLHLAPLNDSMLLVDAEHALIRFHKDNVRAKIVSDARNECSPYGQRFSEIWQEGGEPVSATVLGL